MGQLTVYERGAVERARKILADIKADRSTPDYARHLGRLEVTARTLLTIIENLTADGDGGKGAPDGRRDSQPGHAARSVRHAGGR